MAKMYTVKGSQIFIGGRAPDKGTLTAADFEGVEWTEIDGWTTAGALGDAQEVIEQAVINSDRVTKSKGTKNGGTMENTFIPDGLDPGQVAFERAIEDDCSNYFFKVQWGSSCAPAFDAIITDGVVAWRGHGLRVNQPVVFAGDELPAGVVAETVYYVLEDGLTPNAFTFSEARGGAAVTTTGTSDPVTVTAPPVNRVVMFSGLAMSGTISGGESDTPNLQSYSIAVNSNLVKA